MRKAVYVVTSNEVVDVGMASFQLQTKMIGLFISQKAVVGY
jgi:hypothetical protein